tara:strand:- start:91 stop:444 length:354 start_codon:yes stop_codon:yes gene_type:complete
MNTLSANSPKVMMVFTRPQILGLILQHLGYNMNGHKCMAQTKSGTRCSRKNCTTTFFCKQHEAMWLRDFSFDLFYHKMSWETRVEYWILFKEYNEHAKKSKEEIFAALPLRQTPCFS